MKTENNISKDIPAEKTPPTDAECAARFSALKEQHGQEEALRRETLQLLHSDSARTVTELKLKYQSDPLQYQEKLVSLTAYFDEQWYLKQYPEAAASPLTPVRHYLKTGWLQGWNPSAHFDTCFYLHSCPAAEYLNINPLVYYLETGIKDTFLPCCLNQLPPGKDHALLLQSSLFDAEYYQSQLPSRVCSGADPACHYLVFGWKKRFDPSPDFSVSQYFMANPDIQAANADPLLHYLRYGKKEGRPVHSRNYDLLKESPFFDAEKYRTRYGNELRGFSPLEHYLLFGWKKQNLPSDLFSDKYYTDFYTDLISLGEPPLCHYLRAGKMEGRKVFPAYLPQAEYFYPDGFDRKRFQERCDKVLISVHQLDFSGVPVLAWKIASIFAPEQNAAIIAPFGGPLLQRCLDSGIPVIVDPHFYMNSQTSSEFPYPGFKVCVFNTLCLAGIFLHYSRMIPSLLWIHENNSVDFLPECLHEQIRFAPFVFATSEFTRSRVREYADNVQFLPYPIVDRGNKTKSAVPSFFRFALVAKLETRKGQDIAIRAFRSLPPKYRKKASLSLIGDSVSDDLPSELKKLAGREKNIRFLDTVTDPDDYHALYDNMEVLLCPSRTDPMPLVVFDAMMHGCPVILSDTVGQKDFIRNGKNGFVFPAEDENALASCMMKMIDQASSFPQMSNLIRQTFLDNFEFAKAKKTIRETIAKVESMVLPEE